MHANPDLKFFIADDQRVTQTTAVKTSFCAANHFAPSKMIFQGELGNSLFKIDLPARVIRALVVKSGCSQGLHEINGSQQEAWRKTIEIFEQGQARPRRVAMFPDDRCDGVDDTDIVRIPLNQRTNCRYIRRGSWVPAGWRPSCGSNWDWTVSGPSICRRATKARVGIGYYWF